MLTQLFVAGVANDHGPGVGAHCIAVTDDIMTFSRMIYANNGECRNQNNRNDQTKGNAFCFAIKLFHIPTITKRLLAGVFKCYRLK